MTRDPKQMGRTTSKTPPKVKASASKASKVKASASKASRAKRSSAKTSRPRPTGRKGTSAMPAWAASTPAVASVIVGIGASAGGLAACKLLVKSLPRGKDMAFVLVQHLSPDHESLLVELLPRSTILDVVEATHGMTLLPDRIHIIQPNTNIAVKSGRLQVTPANERSGFRLPIDHFLRSLALDQRERAVAIILSGTGSDGSMGVKAVKELGGLTIVQEPTTAEYDGMPRSALATGLVDLVLPAEDMSGALVQYAGHPYTSGTAVSSATERTVDYLDEILGVLKSRTTHDLRSYRKSTVERRIHRRMCLNYIESPADYLELLKGDKSEIDRLFRDLLIRVTSFFRDPQAYRILDETVIADIVNHHPAESTIRVWIAGCSTGEEAYSVAILIHRRLVQVRKTTAVQVFATDIDESALEFARAGTYSESAVSDVPKDILCRYFDKVDGLHRVTRAIRESVIFAPQNLIQDPPFSRLDLVSCRNLLIYLEPAAQSRVLTLFHFALTLHGYMFLGGSESLGSRPQMFEAVSKKWRIYKRIGPTQMPDADLHSFSPQRHELGTQSTPTGGVTSIGINAPNLPDLLRRWLVSRHGPASVLISPDLRVICCQGETDPYLKIPEGDATHNLMSLVREPFRSSVRSVVGRIHKGSDQAEVAEGVPTSTDPPSRVFISAVPFAVKGYEELIVVSFRVKPIDAKSTADVAAKPNESEVLEQLELEIKAAREELQSTTEEFEASNEELKASNEEVMSINEELQSANEELQSSKEELQSLNEELSTVNTQLHERVNELAETSNDLLNLLTSTAVGTIFLDPELRIKRFTAASTRLFNLIPTDIGRLITDISHPSLESGFYEEVQEVLKTLVPAEATVLARDGTWYLRRVLPYRTIANRIEGVVVTFTEITRLMEAEEELRQSRDELKKLVEKRTRDQRAANEKLRLEIKKDRKPG